ncbi:MAG: hypothetical protein IPO04_22665 [Cytophagaceae bacterium]|nr:hypothetical protein [Cytophagaceae bacterium]
MLNQNETYRRHDFRPMNVTPPTVCISTCRIEQDETNWYAQHSFQLFQAFGVENAAILDIMNHLPVVPMLRLGVLYTTVMEQLLGATLAL